MPSNTKGTTSKQVSYRGLVYAVAGRERPFDVYRFSGVRKYERPNQNYNNFTKTP